MPAPKINLPLEEVQWDDPTQTDEVRWEEYRKRYDLIVLPPKNGDDPAEGDSDRIPGSFEIPIRGMPEGWRLGFVPKGVISFRSVTPDPI